MLKLIKPIMVKKPKIIKVGTNVGGLWLKLLQKYSRFTQRKMQKINETIEIQGPIMKVARSSTIPDAIQKNMLKSYPCFKLRLLLWDGCLLKEE